MINIKIVVNAAKDQIKKYRLISKGMSNNYLNSFY